MSISRRCIMPSRPGMMPARNAPIASSWIISVASCPSPLTLPIVWCIPRHTSKVLSPITSTLTTVPQGCACTIVCAEPPCSDTDPQQRTKYGGSHLIIPHEAQYDDHLFPTILEPRNHRGPLIDPVTGETCPMEVVGDFRATDPIFKGSYGDSFLYLDDDLVRLRWQKVYLPIFQEEIPVPAALSYRQSREPVSAKQSPCRVAAPNTAVESITTRRSSSKGGAPQSLGHNSKTSPPKCPDSTLAKTPPHPQKSTPDCPAKSLQARSSWKHGCSPSPAMELAKNK